MDAREELIEAIKALRNEVVAMAEPLTTNPDPEIQALGLGWLALTDKVDAELQKVK